LKSMKRPAKKKGGMSADLLSEKTDRRRVSLTRKKRRLEENRALSKGDMRGAIIKGKREILDGNLNPSGKHCNLERKEVRGGGRGS